MKCFCNCDHFRFKVDDNKEAINNRCLNCSHFLNDHFKEDEPIIKRSKQAE